MQVTDDRENPEVYWHWRTNMAYGLATWNAKLVDASGYVRRVRGRFPGDNIPDLTAEQLELEAITRYNSGPYWKWDTSLKRWYADPPLANGRPYYLTVYNDASQVCGL